MFLYMILSATPEAPIPMECSVIHTKDNTVVCHLNGMILCTTLKSPDPILSSKQLQCSQNNQLIDVVKLQYFGNCSFVQFALLSII